MSFSEQNLVWIDLEMTGLAPESNRILEIATIVTDPQLNILGHGPELAIHQSAAVLQRMDEWCTNQHTQSGLIERVRTSTVTEAQAEQMTMDFLSQFVPSGKSPMCGNSICLDRRFLYLYMPRLEKFFHYRHIDVSTLKELALRWAPNIMDTMEKESRHRARDDIVESLEELRFYRKNFIGMLNVY